MKEHELTTADLARPTEQFRGHSDEQVVARESREAPLTEAPAGAPAPGPATQPRRDDLNTSAARADRDSQIRTALFAGDEAAHFQNRWAEVQGGFVDEPRAAVERADSLVAEVMKKLAEGFAGERAALERQWDRGDNVTTEDLRLALQRYRSFFDRLLKV